MDEIILQRARQNLRQAQLLIGDTKNGLVTTGRMCACCALFKFDDIHQKRLARQVEALERKAEALLREFEKVAEGYATEDDEVEL